MKNLRLVAALMLSPMCMVSIADTVRADIGFPTNGYQTPFYRLFVPTGVDVVFNDRSEGNPTEWHWSFVNTSVNCESLVSDEQNPTINFKYDGFYDVTLKVSDGENSDEICYYEGIQVGGSQMVWNITDEESERMQKVELGWYGNYAGSNWLGMDAFAEKFKPTLNEEATIDSVAIYFASTANISPFQVITVEVCDADNNQPGEVLASGSLRVNQLIYNASYYEPTIFTLDHAASPKGEFFVCVKGFPNKSTSKGSDDIAILCVRRETPGSLNTAWQFLADEDGKGGYLETGAWYENTDDPLSMAISAIVNYGNTTAIEEVKSVSQGAAFRKVLMNNRLQISNGIETYHLDGTR